MTREEKEKLRDLLNEQLGEDDAKKAARGEKILDVWAASNPAYQPDKGQSSDGSLVNNIKLR